MLFSWEKIVEGLFLSVPSISVYGRCEENDLNDLQVLWNRVPRLITHSYSRIPSTEFFNNLGWMTVGHLIFYHTAITIFRIRQSGEPEYLNVLMTRDNHRGNIAVQNTSLYLAKEFHFQGLSSMEFLPIKNKKHQ